MSNDNAIFIMIEESNAPRDFIEINSFYSKIFLLTITPIFLAKSRVLTVPISGEPMETIFNFINQDVNPFFNDELFFFYHKMKCKFLNI